MWREGYDPKSWSGVGGEGATPPPMALGEGRKENKEEARYSRKRLEKKVLQGDGEKDMIQKAGGGWGGGRSASPSWR